MSEHLPNLDTQLSDTLHPTSSDQHPPRILLL